MVDTKIPYLHLASRLFNTPLLAEPGKLRVYQTVLAERMHIQIIEDDEDEPNEQPASNAERDRLPFQVINGVGIIDVFGALVHRQDFMSAMSGMTGYDAIKRDFILALESPEVESILMRVDSPGGEVGGVFDLADFIRDASTKKPVTAFVEADALSAGYLLASAAPVLIASQTARIGSIGVVATLVDMSEAHRKEGVKVEHIFAGDRKVDGSPHIPLSDDARSAIQFEIDAIYDIFTSKVAAHRNVNEKSVRGTEAGVFVGIDAQAVGLIDSVDSVEVALATAIGAVTIGNRQVSTQMKGRKGMALKNTIAIDVPVSPEATEAAGLSQPESENVEDQPQEDSLTSAQILSKSQIIRKGPGSVMYAAGEGFFALSVDDGESWLSIDPPSAECFCGIAATDSPDVFNLIAEEHAYSTQDAGATWKALPTESEVAADAHQKQLKELQAHRDNCAVLGFSSDFALKLVDAGVSPEAGRALMLEAKSETDEKTVVLSGTGQSLADGDAESRLMVEVEAANKRDEERKKNSLAL